MTEMRFQKTSRAAHESNISLMKRIIFILIMVALPAGLLAIGLMVYVKIIGQNNPINRLVAYYFATAKPLSPYEANWAEVLVLVPVPYVGGNF
jgi:hypothetical protein